MSITRVSAGYDGAVQVSVVGEVDMQTSPELAAALRDAIGEDGSKKVVVDLARVKFMDSSGIRELANALQLASEHNVTFWISSPQTNVRRVLELTGLLTMLTEQAPD